MRLGSSQAKTKPGQLHWASWAQEEACGDHWGQRKQKSRIGQRARILKERMDPSTADPQESEGLQGRNLCPSYHGLVITESL